MYIYTTRDMYTQSQEWTESEDAYQFAYIFHKKDNQQNKMHAKPAQKAMLGIDNSNQLSTTSSVFA